jgi:hypothetical protein
MVRFNLKEMVSSIRWTEGPNSYSERMSEKIIHGFAWNLMAVVQLSLIGTTRHGLTICHLKNLLYMHYFWDPFNYVIEKPCQITFWAKRRAFKLQYNLLPCRNVTYPSAYLVLWRHGVISGTKFGQLRFKDMHQFLPSATESRPTLHSNEKKCEVSE